MTRRLVPAAPPVQPDTPPHPCDDRSLALTAALRETMRAHAPEWTDSNDSDPGVTMLEYVERLVDRLPAGIDGDSEPSRIEEGCRVVVAQSDEAGAALSRIVREAGGWKVDSSYVPREAR